MSESTSESTYKDHHHITEEILWNHFENKQLAVPLKTMIDDLNYHSIDLNKIQKTFDDHAELINESEFTMILTNVLSYYTENNNKIKNIRTLMNKSISNYYSDKLAMKTYVPEQEESKEVIPEWFAKRKEEKHQKQEANKSENNDKALEEMDDETLIQLYEATKGSDALKNQIAALEQEIYNRGKIATGR